MLPATTLIHKAAMPIGIHAVRSFARHFRNTHRLHIHTDGSTDEGDHQELLAAAEGMDARIVTPDDRAPLISKSLSQYPRTAALLKRGAYFTKLELPMFEQTPYFYFDSDIVWLRHVENLAPPQAANAFSTESWSWYNGVAKDSRWIEAKTPRRVNSGFYHIGQTFPYAKMEDMLARGMFDPTKDYNTDQEILAYLYNDMLYYHPEDLKRSRVRRIYDLSQEPCAALHFPGKMWLPHMDQIVACHESPVGKTLSVRYQPPVPLDRLELFRMRARVRISNSQLLGKPINLLRNSRTLFSR